VRRPAATATTSEIARLLRRATFGPHPGQAEALTELGVDGVRAALLAGSDPFAGPVTEVDLDPLPDDYGALGRWWLAQMARPDAGLHEKMVWFWHSHFTSSLDKCGQPSLIAQHRLVRQHALGNFAALCRAMVTDGAMLIYLDGDYSVGSAPNENLARELMELFTVGRGAYSEADVKAAARSLSGWTVDYDTGTATYDPELGYQGAVAFLGRRGRFTPAEIVDALCAEEQCARHVAARVYRFLAGVEPTPARLDAVAAVFRDSDLEIAPLVAEILAGPELAEPATTRPRYPIEWFVGALAALDVEPARDEHLWALAGLGQEPFRPPNVGGWPEGPTWLSASAVLTKTTVLFELEPRFDFAFDEADPVPDALARCGLFTVSDATRATIEQAYWAPFDAPTVHRLLVQLTLSCPEFAVL
jgi:uncharacterized protein (DUF1800 family)